LDREETKKTSSKEEEIEQNQEKIELDGSDTISR